MIRCNMDIGKQLEYFIKNKSNDNISTETPSLIFEQVPQSKPKEEPLNQLESFIFSDNNKNDSDTNTDVSSLNTDDFELDNTRIDIILFPEDKKKLDTTSKKYSFPKEFITLQGINQNKPMNYFDKSSNNSFSDSSVPTFEA